MTTSTVIIVVAVALLAALVGAAPSRARSRQPAAQRASRRHSGDRRANRQTDLIAMVERTSREVRAGAAIRSALQSTLQLHPTLLRSLAEQLSRGASLPQALADTQPTVRGDEAFVLHGLRLTVDNGGAMADTLDRVVAVVRERHVWRGERHAQAAQARLSAQMLTVLPMAVAVWGVVSGPRVRQAYVESATAGVMAVVGVVLNVTGWWWMRHLVRGPDSR